jgi:hypothetical protein
VEQCRFAGGSQHAQHSHILVLKLPPMMRFLLYGKRLDGVVSVCDGAAAGIDWAVTFFISISTSSNWSVPTFLIACLVGSSRKNSPAFPGSSLHLPSGVKIRTAPSVICTSAFVG